MRFLTRIAVLFTVTVLAGVWRLGAATCPVPSANHATIHAAIVDASCTEIVLTAQVYPESVLIQRTLVLQGAGSSATTIEGQVEVSAGVVDLVGLTIDASTLPLAGVYAAAAVVNGGGQVLGSDLVARNGTVLFADGFETGNTTAWSSTVP